MTYQERNRIDADNVEKAALHIIARVKRFETSDGKPYDAERIVQDIAYVNYKSGGNFGGAYIRGDLLTRVRDSVLSRILPSAFYPG